MNRFQTLSVLLLATSISAQGVRVNVSIQNAAPNNGTFQTPVWVGFHNGSFDSYDGGALASSLPIPGSDAIERLAEDGTTGPISTDFDTLGHGIVQATMAGPNGPIAPGDATTMSFLLDPNDPRSRYFSYASMVIPSNDAFVANGNPLAHPVFDVTGNFVGGDFFVAGPNAVNDAGTEVNDEIPMNTAFFGQMAPNTGQVESNPIITHPGFMDRDAGGILASPRFRESDFTLNGYPFLRFTMRAAPAVTDVRTYSSLLLGAFEVPPVAAPGIGISAAALLDEGTRIAVVVQTFGLTDLTMAHLHLGPVGVNGPVVVDLLADTQPGTQGFSTFFVADIDSNDLTGPLADYPLDELVRRIETGEIYVNLHSSANPSGELRGQLARIN